MGREASITVEQVHAVADALKAEGGRATVRNVRDRLGTGSNATINKYLQSWPGKHHIGPVAEVVLPSALNRVITEFIGAEIAGARAPLEAEIADQLQANSDLASENDRQASTIEDLQAQLEMTAGEKSVAEGRAAILTADLQNAKEDAVRERQAAEQARTELAKAQLRLEAMPRLTQDLEAVRAELERERAGRIAAEQKAAVLEAKNTDLEARASEAKAAATHSADELKKLQQRADQKSDELADARVTLKTAQARIDDLVSQIDACRREIEQERAAAGSAKEEAATLRGQLSGKAGGRG